jgi:hypothetical protein
MCRRIHGEVTNQICQGIIFSYFITAWGKEGEDDARRRGLGFNGFNNWAALLKFSKTGTVHHPKGLAFGWVVLCSPPIGFD